MLNSDQKKKNVEFFDQKKKRMLNFMTQKKERMLDLEKRKKNFGYFSILYT